MNCANVGFVLKKMVSFRAGAVMRMVKSPAQAAATQVGAAVAKEVEGVGARDLECAVSERAREGYHGDEGGFEGFTYDEVAEGKCWALSCEQVGWEDSYMWHLMGLEDVDMHPRYRMNRFIKNPT